MELNDLLLGPLLILCSLVQMSLPRTLLKTLPAGFGEYKNHYNPEENLGSTLFLAEGDILIDRELYYSMLGRENPETSGEGGGSERQVDEQHGGASNMRPPSGASNMRPPSGASSVRPLNSTTAAASSFLRRGQRQKRSIDSSYHLMWMNRSVPYEFDANFGPKERVMVEKAMAVLENLSCVQFTKRWHEADYVHILVPEQGGCYSKVGRNGGRQDIGLSPDCHFGTVIHELLHALGLWHEHNRKDRDTYISVLWDNIKVDKKDNFYIPKGQSTKDVVLQKPYDYGSIMHYANNTFSNNGLRPTLVAKKPLPPGVHMGQRIWPSRLDMDKLNALYMCDIRNCSQPRQVSNGNIVGQSYTVGSKVTYRCIPGYVMVGAPERTCMTIGQWSGDQPSCLPDTTRDPIHYCNYDQPGHSLCGWTQATDDELDWTTNSGGTDTKGTGPYWDNTLNTASGTYLYVEATTRIKETKIQARLISPTFETNDFNNLCFVFFTYMYGMSMGSLSVYRQTEDTSSNTTTTNEELLFTINGDQGNKWRQIFLVLGKMSEPFNIILEGSIGGYASDIAIDDLVVGSCKDFKPLALSGGLQSSLECSFDAGHLCQFMQDRHDTADWIVTRGTTPTFNTGPDCDPIDCASGHYLYLEASVPRRAGDTAELKTPIIGGRGPACLSFYYHMYGDHIGSLTIKRVNAISGHENTLWVKAGDQGDRWFSDHLEYIALEAYEISIEGVVGMGYRGDIAIDGISITRGACTGLMNFNCNFEHDLCGWTNVLPHGDTKDWTRHSGETDTPSTGPSADRTDPDGYYLYVESSRSFEYDSARLISPTVPQSRSGYCLQFWYHMYGQRTGNLTVILQSEIGEEDAVWTMSGDQGDDWIFQKVHLTSFPTQAIHVMFEVKLNGYTGDTAIDDISIHAGSCGHSNVGHA